MSDSDWTEELDPTPQPKKRGIGKWIAWGCGCGCLVFVALGIILGVTVVSAVRTGSDPDVQWAKLKPYLAYDERPEDVVLFGIDLWEFEQYYLVAEDEGMMAMLMVYEPGIPVSTALGQVGPMRSSVEREVVQLQGREVEVMWHETEFDFTSWFGVEGANSRTLAIDLSDDEHTLVLQFQNLASSEEFDFALVEEFLAPFDLWRNR